MNTAPVRRWLREPLTHFLVFGALLFLISSWTGGPSGRAGRIVITRGRVEELKAGFLRTWQRPPTEGELKGLIDEDVKDEVSVREAVAKGIDLSDPIIRRRLRRKLELSSEEGVEVASPTDEDLRAFLAVYPEFAGLSSGAEGRQELEHAWRAALRKQRSEALFRALLARYDVVIEGRAGARQNERSGKTP